MSLGSGQLWMTKTRESNAIEKWGDRTQGHAFWVSAYRRQAVLSCPALPDPCVQYRHPFALQGLPVGVQ